MNLFKIENIPSKNPAAGVTMRVIPGKLMTMVFFDMESGSKVPEHDHPHEQMGTVIKGAVALTVETEKKVVRAGEAYHIPSDVPHCAECLEPDTRVLEMFSPPREDLMQG